MQGTSLTKQEREYKLYDEFDKFAYKKGETLRDFYLRFSLLLNDINIYNVKLEQSQVNTKFSNTLPSEWSKFVTNVKLVRDLHTTNIDQLHAYLGQHEFHANEVRLMHERTTRIYTSGASGSNSGKQRTVICYNCKGEGHMSKQCTKRKRKRDDSWFKDKVLLVQAQANGQILHEEELAFLADPGITEDVLAEEHNSDNMDNNMINQDVQIIAEPKIYDGNVIKNTSAIVIPDSEETLMLAEESQTTTTAIAEGSWGFEHTKACFRDEIIPFVKALKDIFNTFDQYLIDELTEVQNVFHQMEQAVEQHPQSQEKDTVIKKLKDRIKSLSGNMNKDKVKKDIEEIKTINIELDHREKNLVIIALTNELRKLRGKDLADNVVTKHTIDPEVLNVDVESIAPKLLNNKTAHSDYLRHTQEQAAILMEHSKLNANSELLCVKCNGCMLSDNHDLCVLDFINDVNAHTKSKYVNKSSKRKVWKPTGKVFTNIGYTWRPTSRTFTIVGNACPLTSITTTVEVALRKLTALESDTPKPVVTFVYSRKPRKSKTNVPVSKPKIIKSSSANNREPSKSWGSIVSYVPSSSLDKCRSSKLFSSIWTPAAPNI
ncbi:retrovirus-related pol polyprotein from transposon TNT 1-94 [Tanacetum coccineum]